MTEEQLQSAAFQTCWNTMPETRGKIRLVHNNPKNKVHGGQLKAMGLIAGTSDHMFIIPGGVVWLECKLENGIQSQAQKDFEKMVKSIPGHLYYIYRSVDEFINLIKKHL